MASIVTTSFTAAGTVSAGYPIDEAVTPSVRHILIATLANAEVLTINHSTDSERVRKVLVINSSTGAIVAAATVAVVYTDANTTTLTAGGAGAGTYRIIIEI